MKKADVATAVILLVVVMFATSALVGSETATSSPVPPKDLKLVGDHWTAWDPPPAGPDAYIIEKGDCLWDLAGKWLNDPFLWPQIWDENRYILDSHWIYPGDPLVIPGRPTVVPPEGPPEIEEIEDVGDEAEPAVDQGFGRGEEDEPEPAPVPAPLPLLPVADPADIYCSGYIDPEPVDSGIQVIGGELERESMGQGDIVYINQGRNQGVQPGAELAIHRTTREVMHPVSEQSLGRYVRRMGKVRIIAVQEETSTGLIEESCEDIQVGDRLVGWEEIPIPMMTGMPPFDRYDVTPSGGSQGYLVAIRDEITEAGAGHVVYTDIGLNTDAEAGDVLTLYRDNGDLPRLMIGQAVILTVEPSTCTAKITNSVREMNVGDRVEIKR